jgi:hypothetical protein
MRCRYRPIVSWAAKTINSQAIFVYKCMFVSHSNVCFEKQPIGKQSTSTVPEMSDNSVRDLDQESKQAEGRIWTSPYSSDELIKFVEEWPSLGHYFRHQLSGPNADRIVIVS